MSAPVARTASGSRPLTVACVPTGMKAGVATVPWGVMISPRRAAPSVAIRRNWKAGIGTLVLRTEQQAGVPVGIEAIACRDGMRIGLLHHLQATEGRDQHVKR